MRRHGKKLAIILVFVITLFSGCKSHETESAILDLPKLKANGEFHFGALEWGMSYESVSQLLPYELKHDGSRAPFPTNGAFYISEGSCSLDSQQGNILLDFFDGKLSIVRFSFQLGNNYEQWFNNLVAQLIQLYGTEDAKIDNFSETQDLTTIGYKWDAGNTSLQFVLQYGEGVEPSATLSVGVLP